MKKRRVVLKEEYVEVVGGIYSAILLEYLVCASDGGQNPVKLDYGTIKDNTFMPMPDINVSLEELAELGFVKLGKTILHVIIPKIEEAVGDLTIDRLGYGILPNVPIAPPTQKFAVQSNSADFIEGGDKVRSAFTEATGIDISSCSYSNVADKWVMPINRWIRTHGSAERAIYAMKMAYASHVESKLGISSPQSIDYAMKKIIKKAGVSAR